MKSVREINFDLRPWLVMSLQYLTLSIVAGLRHGAASSSSSSIKSQVAPFPRLYESRILRLNRKCEGVTELPKRVVFGALPQETVHAISDRGKKPLQLSAVKVIDNPSPDRVVPKCPHFGVCGGCSFMHVEPDAQVRFKHDFLLQELKDLGHVSPRVVLTAFRSPSTGYRHKGRFTIRYRSVKDSSEAPWMKAVRACHDPASSSPPMSCHPSLNISSSNVADVNLSLNSSDTSHAPQLLMGWRDRVSSNFVTNVQQCPILHPSIGSPEALQTIRNTLQRLSPAVQSQLATLEFAVGDFTSALIVRHMIPLTEQDRSVLVDLGRILNVWVYSQAGARDRLEPLHEGASADLSFSFSASPYRDSPPFLSYTVEVRFPIGDLPSQTFLYRFRPVDFTQINRVINQRIVQEVVNQAFPIPLSSQVPELASSELSPDVVLDLFCGIGNFSIALAGTAAALSRTRNSRASFVMGLELDGSMVEGAYQNALLNKLSASRHRLPATLSSTNSDCVGDVSTSNLHFQQADLYQESKIMNFFSSAQLESGTLASILQKASLPSSSPLSSRLSPANITVVLDPPRSGAMCVIKSGLMDASLWNVQKIIYISCNPTSLAIDAGVLVHDYGFELSSARLADMFPHTSHSEAVCVFSRTSMSG